MAKTKTRKGMPSISITKTGVARPLNALVQAVRLTRHGKLAQPASRFPEIRPK